MDGTASGTEINIDGGENTVKTPVVHLLEKLAEKIYFSPTQLFVKHSNFVLDDFFNAIDVTIRFGLEHNFMPRRGLTSTNEFVSSSYFERMENDRLKEEINEKFEAGMISEEQKETLLKELEVDDYAWSMARVGKMLLNLKKRNDFFFEQVSEATNLDLKSWIEVGSGPLSDFYTAVEYTAKFLDKSLVPLETELNPCGSGKHMFETFPTWVALPSILELSFVEVPPIGMTSNQLIETYLAAGCYSQRSPATFFKSLFSAACYASLTKLNRTPVKGQSLVTQRLTDNAEETSAKTFEDDILPSHILSFHTSTAPLQNTEKEISGLTFDNDVDMSEESYMTRYMTLIHMALVDEIRELQASMVKEILEKLFPETLAEKVQAFRTIVQDKVARMVSEVASNAVDPEEKPNLELLLYVIEKTHNFFVKVFPHMLRSQMEDKGQSDWSSQLEEILSKNARDMCALMEKWLFCLMVKSVTHCQNMVLLTCLDYHRSALITGDVDTKPKVWYLSLDIYYCLALDNVEDELRSSSFRKKEAVNKANQNIIDTIKAQEELVDKNEELKRISEALEPMVDPEKADPIEQILLEVLLPTSDSMKVPKNMVKEKWVVDGENFQGYWKRYMADMGLLDTNLQAFMEKSMKALCAHILTGIKNKLEEEKNGVACDIDKEDRNLAQAGVESLSNSDIRDFIEKHSDEFIGYCHPYCFTIISYLYANLSKSRLSDEIKENNSIRELLPLYHLYQASNEYKEKEIPILYSTKEEDQEERAFMIEKVNSVIQLITAEMMTKGFIHLRAGDFSTFITLIHHHMRIVMEKSWKSNEENTLKIYLEASGEKQEEEKEEEEEGKFKFLHNLKMKTERQKWLKYNSWIITIKDYITSSKDKEKITKNTEEQETKKQEGEKDEKPMTMEELLAIYVLECYLEVNKIKWLSEGPQSTQKLTDYLNTVWTTMRTQATSEPETK